MIAELRPWGKFEILSDAPGYKLKLLYIEPGQRTSLQRHCDRYEHLFIIDGMARIESQTIDCHGHSGGQDFCIGQDIRINPFEIHRIGNKQKERAIILEVSISCDALKSVSEDDIQRFEDDYGRPVDGKLAEEEGQWS